MKILAVLAISIAMLCWLSSKTHRQSYSLSTAAIRAFSLVISAQCVAMSVQLLFGSLAYVADGPLEIGFPRVFYRATVWVEAPTWDLYELEANAWFSVLAFGFYTSGLLIRSNRREDVGTDEASV